MAREEYIGNSAFEWSAKGDNDRKKWLKELDDLCQSLEGEFNSNEHSDFEKNVTEWENHLNRLHGLIYTEIRNLAIRRMVGEQLPFLFVGAGVATGVGAWVARIASGSRWLVILAKGTTLTIINVAGSAAATGKSPTVSGVAIQFGTNPVLAGLGQVFQALGASLEAAQGMSAIRRMLLLPSLKAGGFAATTPLQPAVQSFENEATTQGGESSFTEMLTLNLLMNGLGLQFGAALKTEPAGGTSRALALATPKEIVAQWAAKGVVIDEQAAKEWLDRANRSAEFEARYQRLVKDAKTGKLTQEEFEKWRKEGLALVDELSEKLPKLSKVIGAEKSPEEIQGVLKALRSRLDRVTFGGPVLLLPEYTGGLMQVGDGPSWTYDPANPPKRLRALLKALEDRGMSVRELPEGGFEVIDSKGKVVLQTLPLAPAAANALPVSLEALAQGPKAAQGLDRVRSQTAVPELQAQLAQAAQKNRNAVVRLLQVLARGQDKSPAPVVA